MLTDHQARELLAAAADTIDVTPTTFDVTPVRRWPAVLAAAAVVVVLAGATALVGRPDASSPRPAGPPTPASTSSNVPTPVAALSAEDCDRLSSVIERGEDRDVYASQVAITYYFFGGEITISTDDTACIDRHPAVARAVQAELAMLRDIRASECRTSAESACTELTTTDVPGHDIAQQFLRFQREFGPQNPPPDHAEPLPIYVDGVAGEVAGNAEWEVCGIPRIGCDGPSRVRYAEREPVILSTGLQPACFEVPFLPGRDRTRTVMLVPRDDEPGVTCETDWAVVLYVDATWSRIEAAQLATAEGATPAETVVVPIY